MPLVNRQNTDEFNQKLNEIQDKLDNLKTLALVDGDLASFSIPEISKLIQELKEKNPIQEIRHGISELNKKMDQQNEKFNKIILLISKMYHDGEINKDIFDKLDEFLKSYYPTSNLEQDY